METRKQSICVTPDTCSHVRTNFPWDTELEQRLGEGKLLIIKLVMFSFFIFRLKNYGNIHQDNSILIALFRSTHATQ